MDHRVIAELITVANGAERLFTMPWSRSYICILRVGEGTGCTNEKIMGCYLKARFYVNAEQENTEDATKEVLF